jgi:hypothetical protein
VKAKHHVSIEDGKILGIHFYYEDIVPERAFELILSSISNDEVHQGPH